MKVSDYIANFFIEKEITDVFGYPGGMITYFIDSLYKRKEKINAHLNYHEQASSFCACGYAQISHKPGVAYSTSGPGATNLITGIANAFFDSIPCIFITGQVNSNDLKMNPIIRQSGFQETDIISLVKPITKYCKQITKCSDIKYELEKAYYYAINDRTGPVLLDIPIDIQRAEIDIEKLDSFVEPILSESFKYEKILNIILQNLSKAKRPIIIAGQGINLANVRLEFKEFISKLNIPVITSMISVDLMDSNYKLNYGFLGTYGSRYANLITEKSDLIISIGSRLDCRQKGTSNNQFASNAKLIRIDIDKDELNTSIKDDEITLKCNIKELIPIINKNDRFNLKNKYANWINICDKIKEKVKNIDILPEKEIIEKISYQVPDNAIITTDVGQNQVWVAQSFKVKPNQRILFSGGHGAMGYSLPAAIGAYYANRKPIICFNGDGGFQMNIQELQFIVRENLPIKIIILNNHSLGMIRHFQETYFDSRYNQTVKNNGYEVPDFCKIANAYNIRNLNITNINEIDKLKNVLNDKLPILININLNNTTYVYPKSSMENPIYDQEPQIDKNLLNEMLKY